MSFSARPTILLSLFLALFSSGCSLADLVDESQAEAAKTVDLICGECVDLYPDRAECEASFAGPFADDECTVDALELDKAASRETLNCAIDAQKDFNKCLEANLDCDDTDQWSQCEDLYNDAYAGCPGLPAEVREALLGCL